MTEVYIMNTSFLNEPSVFSEKLKELSEYRRERALSFKNNSDRVRSLGAGMLIQYGLKKRGLNEREMKYSLNKHGKPYFKDCPDVHFNVSHSGDLAACAFSEYDVGCDIEMVRTPDYNVAERFFADDEIKYVYNQKNENERAKAFFGIWTLKESFVKAEGRGLSLPFREFSALSGRDEPSAMYYDAMYYEKKKYYFKAYVYGKYVIACCCIRPNFSEEPEIIDEERCSDFKINLS